MNGDHPRTAFTLLELLVVIAISGILVALTIPAVQRVRAAANRVACANHLKQMGLGLHQYHDAHNVLPPGCSDGNGKDRYPYMSWMTRLLPHLEQESLWQQVLGAFAQDKFFEGPPHLPILGLVLPIFTCPEDSRTSEPWNFGPFQVGLTAYQGVAGTDSTRFDGLLYVNSHVRLADITDGTSNTLAVGERPPSFDHRLGWWYAGWGQRKDGSADLVLGVR